MEKTATAAAQLSLPRNGWHHTHYLSLLNLLTSSVAQISEHLKNASPRKFSEWLTIWVVVEVVLPHC